MASLTLEGLEGLEGLEKSSLLRQYSITSAKDAIEIENGRCPHYAINWSHTQNRVYWPKDHDYFLGNGQEITDNPELRKILSEKLARGTLHDKIVFCDLDGVLADFEEGVKIIFKKPIAEVKVAELWGFINKSTTFFETLPWMPRGKELWSQIQKYDPIILTGIPPGSKTSAEQKRAWCERELGPDVHVITCYSKDKPIFCQSQSILIDDSTQNMQEWKLRGGKFIHYNEEILDKVVGKVDRHMKILTGMTSP